MSNIFDFSKINKLISDVHASAVIIVDTNVLINEPDFLKWKTSLKNPVFVISILNIIELEYVKAKNKPQSSGNANRAVVSINNLLRTGEISEGINVKGVGWFVSIPLPKEDAIREELSRLKSLVSAFGQTDIELLLLTSELNQTIGNVTSIFATGEYNLFNLLKAQGLPAYQFESFPMKGLSRLVSYYQERHLSVDWEGLLTDIQKEAHKKLIEVELTLTSKSIAPRWLAQLIGGKESRYILIAEGTGTIKIPTGELEFSWTLPFSQFRLLFLRNNKSEAISSEPKPIESDRLGVVNLDFGEREHDVPEHIIRSLAEKFNQAANPWSYLDGMYTVHDPISVTIFYLLFHYLQRNQQSALTLNDAVEWLRKEINQYNDLSEVEIKELVFYDPESEEEYSSMYHLLLPAINNCWSIGETISINLVQQELHT